MHFLDTSYENYMNAVRHEAKNGTLSYDHMKQLAIKCFGKEIGNSNHLGDFTFNGNYKKLKFKELISCGASKNCIKVEMMARFVIEVSNTYFGFGSFLRNFNGLSHFWSFSQVNSLLHAYDEDVFDLFSYDENLLCDSLQKEETTIHDYFKNVSLMVGFSDDDKVDLYDLPGVVSTLNRSPGNYDPLILEIKMTQALFYSRCAENFDLLMENASDCAIQLQEFLDGATESKL